MTAKLLSRAALVAAFAGTLFAGGSALAAGGHIEKPENIQWSFEGPLGKFDQAQLQRGYKVYREVCAGCHSMKLLSFRNLGDKGGPFYDSRFSNPNDNPYVKAIAAEFEVSDIDSETGDPIQRPATSADRFPSPFPNDAAARASNGGALPPDLSVIAKARVGGPDYLHAILTGYRDPPEGLTVDPGKFYNPWFPGDLTAAWSGDPAHVPAGGVIAMVPPLMEGSVTYDDGTPSTVDQMSLDVSAYMMWAAEPKLNERHQMGAAVILYLLLLSGLLYASYRRVWRNESH